MLVPQPVRFRHKNAVREVAAPSVSAVAPPAWTLIIRRIAVERTPSQPAKRQPKKSSMLPLTTIKLLQGIIASQSVVLTVEISTHAAAQTAQCSRRLLWAAWINHHSRKAPPPKRPTSAKDQSLKTGETAMRRLRSSTRWTRRLITRGRSWGLRLKNLRPRPLLRKQRVSPDRRWARPTMA